MTENRLIEVAGHWLPRMEVAGIPSATAKAVMEAAGTWTNWCRAWSEEGERHRAFAEEALAAGHRLTAGEGFARAALFNHFAQFMFFDDLQQKADASARKVSLFRQAAPLLDPPGEALEVPFENDVLRGFLRVPANGTGHAIILIPGSDSTKEEFPALESHFLRRGIATFSLDGPGQGEGRAFGPLRADFGPALAAVAENLRARPDLSGKLALVGMAFGGYLALRAAGAVGDLSGIVSINGFHDLGAMWPSFPPVYRDNMRFGLGAETAEEAEANAAPFTLAGAPPPDCPVLVLHGALDRIFPPIEAERQAEWAGSRAECTIFPDGNHVCNNIPWLYRPMAADWIADRFAE
ncbi:MAG TPA: alpha/beta fold hydrolase [Afifellaceae bacterium]|nr:alpha/beta fold hydrolase [Afifellaceae bacterium]